MLLAWLAFGAGLALLVAGAEALVRGGSAIATRFGMSPLAVGLTIVALGTSMPEFVVAVAAAATGSTDVALGNVVGSNILNILVVLGITASITPIFVARHAVRQDIPIVAMLSVGVFLLAMDGKLGRVAGIVLVASLLLYMRQLWKRERGPNAESAPEGTAAPQRPMALSIGFLTGGIAALIIGGRGVVWGGTEIATAFGVSERVIALTLVALGTSAPELATSLVAAFRKQVDLAIGNVVGSNILNLVFVLGTAAIVRPIPVSETFLRFDLLLMIFATFLMIMLLLTSSRRRMGRRAGVILLIAYTLYVLAILGVLG